MPQNDEYADLRGAFEKWAEGTRYEHEHCWADPSKFVGHVAASEHRAAEVAVLEGVPALLDEVKRLRLVTEYAAAKSLVEKLIEQRCLSIDGYDDLLLYVSSGDADPFAITPAESALLDGIWRARFEAAKGSPDV